ncbi:MAG: hypothetical protein U5L72_14065 [Bacteroidales bacterium]|nr:hypothetical protein [Bacteroidales bacterium]
MSLHTAAKISVKSEINATSLGTIDRAGQPSSRIYSRSRHQSCDGDKYYHGPGGEHDKEGDPR